MLDFMDITKDNVHLYCRFDKNFEDDLSNFQSRIYPKNSDFFVPMIQNGLLRWSYLFFDGKIIGAIWLEKEHHSLPCATLGIFIADKEKRSQGIGEEAINRYIQMYKEQLNLTEVNLHVRKENIRAIKCYEKCGFVTEQEFEKADGTKALSMTKSLARWQSPVDFAKVS